MNKILKELGALSLVVFFGLSTANAALIEYSQDFTLNNFGSDITTYSSSFSDPSTTSSTASLQRFDSNLGNLTGVNISFTSDWTHNSYASAYDSTAYSYRVRVGTERYRCGNSGFPFYTPRYCYRPVYRTRYDNDTFINTTSENEFTVSLVDPVSSSNNLIDFNYSADCSAAYYRRSYGGSVSCNDSEFDSGNFDRAMDLSGISLDSFIKDGIDDLLNFDLTNYTDVFGYCDDSDFGDRCSAEVNSYWDGNIKVAYTYDVAQDVPEPSVLALMGAGLAGLGIVRRRRKKA